LNKEEHEKSRSCLPETNKIKMNKVELFWWAVCVTEKSCQFDKTRAVLLNEKSHQGENNVLD